MVLDNSPDSSGDGPGTSTEADDIKLLEGVEDEVEDNISDELKDLVEREEDKTPASEEDEEEEETPEEDEEEEKEEPEEEDDKDVNFEDRPSPRELVAAYPDIFKKFPALKQSIFREREYTEVFPTVGEAKVAAERVGFVDRLSSELIQKADPTLLFKSIAQVDNGESLAKLTESILPNIYHNAPALYENMTKPLMVNLVHEMFENFGRNETPADGEKYTNGQKAALVLAKHLFGEAKLPERVKQREEPKEDKEKIALRNQLEQRDTQIRDNHIIRIKGNVDKSLTQAILSRVDPKNVLPKVLRETLVEKGINKIMAKVGSSPEHKDRVAKLWLKARENGYPEEALASIRTTVLARSKALLPSVITELTKDLRKPSNPDIKKAPKGAKLGAGTMSKPGKVMTAKELNKSGMSDSDFLRS